MVENFDHPRDIAPAAIQFLFHDGFQRIDGACEWKGDKWKYTIYKLNDAADTIRIDLVKKSKKEKKLFSGF